jgi:hypothetical protein
MMPTEPPPEGTPLPPLAAEPEAPKAPEPPEPVYRWYHKVFAVVFITFCLDIGLFLLICPWTEWWDNVTAFLHVVRPFLDTMYARGAISGVGVLNLYISLGEVFRLRRFSK